MLFVEASATGHLRPDRHLANGSVLLSLRPDMSQQVPFFKLRTVREQAERTTERRDGIFGLVAALRHDRWRHEVDENVCGGTFENLS